MSAELEKLVGMEVGNEVVDLEVLSANLRKYFGGRALEDEEMFTFFNALTLFEGRYHRKACQLAVPYISIYIKKSRRKLEADLMLCDLIVDHWPVDISIVLTEELLLCRWNHRVAQFIGELHYHGSRMRPDYRAALIQLLQALPGEQVSPRRRQQLAQIRGLVSD